MFLRRFTFVRHRKIGYICSAILIVAGIVSLCFQGLNLGIDYTGGSTLQIRFAQSTDIATIRAELAKDGLDKTPIQAVDGDTYILKMPYMEAAERDAFLDGLRANLGELTLDRSNAIGPSMGSEIFRKGLIALGIATMLMVVYISVRFEWRFALAGLLALFHDIFITVAFFSIFQWELDSTFIAAILTLFGYSINDTIVIFDRIRERLGRIKRDDLETEVDDAINNTMTRSLYTSGSTLILLVALLIFGGATTKMFVLAMTIGVAFGAYSSIFIAAPLWYDFSLRSKKKRF